MKIFVRNIFHDYFKMTERRAQMEPSVEELKKFTAKVCIEGKIARARDLIADLEGDKWHTNRITEKLESLVETIDSCLEDACLEDLEKIVRAFADKDILRYIDEQHL